MEREVIKKRFTSGKTYTHATGHSCAFRQWKAETTHCKFLHGYGISFKLWFEGDLDERNWVYDFGDCKWIKEFLEDTFDHTLVIASDDPEVELFKGLYEKKVCKLWVLDNVGCEKFAELVYVYVAPTLKEKTEGRVSLQSVECFEHGANSAIYLG